MLVAYEGGGGRGRGEFSTMCYTGILYLKDQATFTGFKYGNGIGIHAVRYQREYKKKKKDRNQWKYHTLANKVGEFKHLAKKLP